MLTVVNIEAWSSSCEQRLVINACKTKNLLLMSIRMTSSRCYCSCLHGNVHDLTRTSITPLCKLLLRHVLGINFI